jgi:hypothetical protein
MTTAAKRQWAMSYREKEREQLRLLRLARRSIPVTFIRPTPDTHPMFWQAADGWRGAYRGFAVGPYADYAAACLALADCLRETANRIAPMEATP